MKDLSDDPSHQEVDLAFSIRMEVTDSIHQQSCSGCPITNRFPVTDERAGLDKNLRPRQACAVTVCCECARQTNIH